MSSMDRNGEVEDSLAVPSGDTIVDIGNCQHQGQKKGQECDRIARLDFGRSRGS
jgi:hypothetical protein